MVLYPGHPLVGRIVPVVRRYGQRERGQWVIELPDGSRQYVPTSWCSPVSSEGPPAVPASSEDGSPPEGPVPSPLSVEALRNLAALVRRLREEGVQRGEEQQDVGPGGREDTARGETTEEEDQTSIADMGELPTGGSAPISVYDPADRTTPPGGGTDEQPSAEVREP